MSKIRLYLMCLLLALSAISYGQTPLNVTYALTRPVDSATASGSITLNITGGTAPYSVNWCNGQGTNTQINNISVGVYSVIVQDTVGNMVWLHITLSDSLLWDSLVPNRSQNEYGQGGNSYVSFDIATDTVAMDIGLMYDISGDTTRLDTTIIDAGFHLEYGELSVIIDSTDTIVGNYSSGDRLSVRREGSLYSFYDNNILVYKTLSLVDVGLDAPATRTGYNVFDRSAKSLNLNQIADFNLAQIIKTINQFGKPQLAGLASQKFSYAHNCSKDMNWIYNETYDDNAAVVTASIQFYDYLGRPIQAQSMNVDAYVIMAAETRYDEYGRPVLSTLPAPTVNQTFCYVPHFVTADVFVGFGNSGSTVNMDYTTDLYDNTYFNTVNAPTPVSQATKGQLGWYYSDNNPDRVPSSAYPYSRVEYYSDPTGAVKRASSPGEALRMGSGHEARTFAMPDAGELYAVYGSKNNLPFLKYQHAAVCTAPAGDNCNQKLYNIKMAKTISIDQNGQESVAFTDLDGNTLATCLSGPVDAAKALLPPNATIIIPPGQYRDIHIPAGAGSTVTMNAYEGPGVTPAQATVACPRLSYAAYDINQNYSLISAATAITDNSYFNGLGTTPAYIRIVNNATTGSCSIQINYVQNYYNYSLYYYDEAGRLTAVVPPAGVDYSFTPAATGVVAFDCKAVTDITGSNLNTLSPTYTPGFGPTTIPVTPPTGVQSSGYSVYLSDDCLLPLGSDNSGDAVSGLTGTVVGTARAYWIYVKANSIHGNYDVSQGNGGFGLVYISYSYNDGVNEYTDADGNPVTKGGWGSTQCTTCCGWPQLPVNNNSLLLTEQQSCTETGIDFQVAAIEQFNYDIIRNSTWDLDQLSNETPIGFVSPSTGTCNTDFADVQFLCIGVATETETQPAHTMIQSCQYNSDGNQLWSASPDGGETDYMYRNDGLLRFSQNAQQSPVYKFSYTNYDNANRPTEAGEYDPAVGGANSAIDNILVSTGAAFYFQPNCVVNNVWRPSNPVANILESGTGSLDEARCENITRITYDLPDAALTAATGRNQRFVQGAISKVARFATGNAPQAQQIYWFSYDELGRTEWQVQWDPVLGYKTIDYNYNINGSVQTSTFQLNAHNEIFTHNYAYNQSQSLKSVATTDETHSTQTQAAYQYFLNGSLKRTGIGMLNGNCLQGVDYTYTLQGALKAINSASNTAADLSDPGLDGYGSNAAPGSSNFHDLFGMELDYFNNDYHHSNVFLSDGSYTGSEYPDQFNGNIRSMRWNTNGLTPPVSTSSTWGCAPNKPYLQNMYGFKYDNTTNAMTDAKFGAYVPPGARFYSCAGVTSGMYASTCDHREYGLTYDLNGNIQTLSRTGSTCTVTDALTYNYDANLKNRLTSVSGTPGTGSLIPTQSANNYVYNNIGQATADVADDQAMDYDPYGNIIKVWNAARTQLKVSYAYDALGFRMSKTDYTSAGIPGSATHYINDGSGNVQRIVTTGQILNSDQGYETPVYGLSRLGIRYSTNHYSLGNFPITIPGFAQINPSTEYELNDHLGNVRATFKLQNATLSVTGYADYYPLGMKMPDRQFISANNYRFGYQGQFAEKSDETGYNSFQLREYDPRLGRWFVSDPDAQFWSPYLAMGNNWAAGVDPDGAECPDCPSGTDNASFNSNNGVTYNFYNGSWNPVLTVVDNAPSQFAQAMNYILPSQNNESEEPYKYASKEEEMLAKHPYTAYSYLHPGEANIYMNAFEEGSNEAAEFWMFAVTAPEDIAVGGAALSGAGKALIDGGEVIGEFASGIGSKIKSATGGYKQWFRLGKSYSVSGKFSTYGFRWGASTSKNGKYLKLIGDSQLRALNQSLRTIKIPFGGWRAADPGHFHLWKTPFKLW